MRHHEAMLKSRLLKFSLWIALSTAVVWAAASEGNAEASWGSAGVSRALGEGEAGGSFTRRSEGTLLSGEDAGTDAKQGNIVIRIPVEPPSAVLRSQPRLTTPAPTAAPQKRQDDGQIQALSQRIQSLSQSATQAISSVSSSASSAISLISASAQSVRQSADQAVRSAGDSARSVGQSAASVVSSANSRASSDIAANSASIESRLSSQMSVQMASVQSSASKALGDAQSRASQSILSVMGIATSAVQAANSDADNARTGANTIVSQVQGNSISATNVAIIVVVAVVGSAVISIAASCLIIRFRRKKRSKRERTTPGSSRSSRSFNEKGPAIAFREPDTGGSRFNPFGGGTGYPMDKLVIPGWKNSPVAQQARAGEKNRNDVYGVSQSSFRLQKPPSVKSATSVRLIRVESQKNKGDNRPVESKANETPAQQASAAAGPSNVDTGKRVSELERMERGKEIYRQSSWDDVQDQSRPSSQAPERIPTSPKTPKASFGLMPKVTASPPDPLARRTRFNEFPVRGQLAPAQRRGPENRARSSTRSSVSITGTTSSGTLNWPFDRRGQ